MAQETKVGLLIGLALIFLVGLVLSDLFTGGEPESAEAARAATEFGPGAQAGIYEEPETVYNASPAGREAFDRMPAFAADPPQSYGVPAPTQQPRPTETWSPPAGPRPGYGVSPSPELIVEPPLPQLDTLEARDAMTRFNDSLEALRLAVEEPAPLLPDRINTAADEVTRAKQPSLASLPESSLDSVPLGGTTYIHYVQPGQDLREIARQHYGNPEFAAAIAQTNLNKVDREGQVRPGARLEIPPLGSPVFSRLFKPVHAEHAVQVEDEVPALPGRPAGPTAEVSPQQGGSTIEVQPGDTLSELAAEHLGSAKRWQEIVDVNAEKLSSAADLRSGMKLRLPDRTTINASQASVTSTAKTTTTPVTANAESQQTYTVQAGDNLTRIAARLLGNGERWDELLAANADQLDRPENLRVGMKLKLPSAAVASTPRPPASEPRAKTQTPDTESTYTVQAGDNLTRIAARKLGDGDRWRELFEVNADQLTSPNDLYAGQTLRLP
ncbi:MAG: LysM peptidoglycan-binding domain-containing protein [Planctomycetota bacterium]